MALYALLGVICAPTSDRVRPVAFSSDCKQHLLTSTWGLWDADP